MPFTDQDPIAPLENLLNQAVSEAVSTAGTNLDTLRPIRTFKWADESERNAQVGMTAGDQGYQEDTGVTYRYSGSSWLVEPPLMNVQREGVGSLKRMITQVGGGKLQGNNTAVRAVGVTFPEAFKAGTVPNVLISFSGQKATGADAPGSTEITSTTVSFALYQPSNTQFIANLRISTGTLSSSIDYYYTWIAIGEPA